MTLDNKPSIDPIYPQFMPSRGLKPPNWSSLIMTQGQRCLFHRVANQLSWAELSQAWSILGSARYKYQNQAQCSVHISWASSTHTNTRLVCNSAIPWIKSPWYHLKPWLYLTTQCQYASRYGSQIPITITSRGLAITNEPALHSARDCLARCSARSGSANHEHQIPCSADS